MARRRTTEIKTIYTQLGYVDRYHYFSTLADAFDVDVMKIILVAEKLGPEQDFDALLMWVSGEASRCSSTKTQ